MPTSLAEEESSGRRNEHNKRVSRLKPFCFMMKPL